MKLLLPFFFLLFTLHANAQLKTKRPATRNFTGNEKYLSFNPFGLAEPHIAIGAGFGNRISLRSEYFTELSYVAKNPVYNGTEERLNGVRFLAQYRYHFLQQWKPLLNLGSITEKSRERKLRQSPFIGVEFRIKPFNFSDTRTFIKSSTNDTLGKFPYKANAVSIGGAILFGSTFNISANNKWKLEATAGVGGKVKMVHYKNLPSGYKPFFEQGGFGLKPPAVDEAVGMPYFPCTIRLRYYVN